MGPHILVVVLVPPDLLKRLLRELRGRYPGAHVTALVGSPVGATPKGTDGLRRDLSADDEADDYLHWGSFGARALIAEIRGKRFDLLVVAHGRDYYRKLTYWKAVALAVASGARGKLFCEDGKLGSQRVAIDQLATFSAGVGALTGAVLREWKHAVLPVLTSAYIAAMGLLLLPVLIGIAVSDLTDWLSGARGRASRSARPGQQN